MAIPLPQGAVIRVVGPEFDADFFMRYEELDPVTPTFDLPRHVEIDGIDIGELRECWLSGQSITIEASGPISPQAMSLMFGINAEGMTDREAYRLQQTEHKRQRAFVGDICRSVIGEGMHGSQYEDGHWICQYCHYDTCLPGDCPED